MFFVYLVCGSPWATTPTVYFFIKNKLEKYYQELTQDVAKYSSQIDLTNKLDTQNVDIIRDLEIQ